VTIAKAHAPIPTAPRVHRFTYAIRNIVAEALKVEAAGTRGTVGRNGAAWPASRGDGSRHLLVSDLPAPPDPPAAGVPCTVVHVTETVPAAGPFCIVH